MVPEAGLEPARSQKQRILKSTRLNLLSNINKLKTKKDTLQILCKS